MIEIALAVVLAAWAFVGGAKVGEWGQKKEQQKVEAKRRKAEEGVRLRRLAELRKQEQAQVDAEVDALRGRGK